MISRRKRFKIINTNLTKIININNVSLSNNFAILAHENIENNYISFNNILNHLVDIKDTQINVLSSFNCIFNINFDINITLREYSYSIHTLTVEINNEIFYKKRYGFDALNQINDNIILHLNQGDEIKLYLDSSEYNLGNNSFIYVNIL